MPADLASVLEKVSGELADLTRIAKRLQDQFAARPLSDQDVVTLQSLDYLTQALQCLSEFLSVAARQAPRAQADVSAALQRVWLGAVAARLAGATVPLDGGQAVELFDADPAAAP